MVAKTNLFKMLKALITATKSIIYIIVSNVAFSVF